ncbi:MAG: hypothetical protein E7330_00290 [Clostridiales bacterium]|nr:hypothetical protein [Clostridiales bacterium]
MILRWGANSEPTGFDPHTVSEEASLRIIPQMYETLLGQDKDLNYYGELAESWEISPDSLSYTIKLREGVKFHSGNEVTAEAVKYSFERVLGRTEAGDIGAFGSKATYFGNIDTIEVLDKYTVKFTLSTVTSVFLSNLCSNYGAIVDPEVVKANGDLMRADGGTGPFALSEWKADNYVSLVKFEEYWDADRVKLDGITFYLVGDEAARLAALRTGEIDISTLSASNVQAAAKEENLTVASYQTSDYIALGLNASTPALQDKNVRQAICYAIDRQNIIDIVFSGEAIPTHIIPPSTGHWSVPLSNYDLYTTNVEKAKQMMEAAGYNENNRLTLKVAAGLLDTIRQTAVVIDQQLDAIYIDLEIVNLESGEYVDVWYKMGTTEAGFDAMVVQDGSGLDPNRGIGMFFTTDGSASVFGFSNARVDELCTLALGTADEAVREEYYNECQDIIIDDAGKIGIASPMAYFVISKNLQGFVPTLADSGNYRDAWIEK